MASRFRNHVGPQVRRIRYARGWSQSIFAAHLHLEGLEVSRSWVSKVEARLLYVDDQILIYLAGTLQVNVQDLFPRKSDPNQSVHDFVQKLKSSRF